ncbi:MAG: ATP-binding protein [Vicinamibacterales bacterium]
MTPDVLRRAGEPFFTTKDAGRGYGLGLFLARVFAERAGGELTLESGDGTRAVLTLPGLVEQVKP